MRVFLAILAARQLDDGCKHVKEWDEVEDDRGVHQELIGADGLLIDLTGQENRSGDGRLHQDGDVRRLPFRMDLAEGRRQIAINSHHKRHARNARDRAAHSARIAHGHQHRSQHAQQSDL